MNTTIEKAKQTIAKLIEKYNRIVEEKKLIRYNEEMSKKDFILPLFRGQMLDLNDRLKNLGDKFTDERRRIEEEIKKTDAEIDELVYDIYGITEKERKIIENSFE